MDEIPRPGHVDYTCLVKYGVKAESGGGRCRAGETIGWKHFLHMEKIENMKMNLFTAKIFSGHESEF